MIQSSEFTILNAGHRERVSCRFVTDTISYRDRWEGLSCSQHGGRVHRVHTEEVRHVGAIRVILLVN